MKAVVATMLVLLLAVGVFFMLKIRSIERRPRVTVSYVPHSWHTISNSEAQRTELEADSQQLNLSPRHSKITPHIPTSRGTVSTGDLQRRTQESKPPDDSDTVKLDLRDPSRTE
jgi:hypothetical protein